MSLLPSDTVDIECFCDGRNPGCVKCGGRGFVTRLACRRCHGKGTVAGVRCLDCRGRRYREENLSGWSDREAI